MRFVKPLDQNILKKYLLDAEYFISLEDGSISGGAGSAVQEFCSIENIDIRSKLFGIPDRFIEHASRAEMIEDCGLTAKQMLTELRTMLAK
jgi:1-deoxy-D-xylulose-5-phosphate synthase